MQNISGMTNPSCTNPKGQNSHWSGLGMKLKIIDKAVVVSKRIMAVNWRFMCWMKIRMGMYETS